MDKYEKQIEKYKDQIIEYEQKIAESLDKIIVSLSGGALGLSAIFIKNIIDKPAININFVLAAWICWIASLISILCAHYFGMFLYRQVLNKIAEEKHENLVSRYLGKIIYFFNVAAGILFIMGASCFVYFSYTSNLP